MQWIWVLKVDPWIQSRHCLSSQISAAAFAIHSRGTTLQKPLRNECWNRIGQPVPALAMQSSSGPHHISHNLTPRDGHELVQYATKKSGREDIESTKECTWYGVFRTCQSPKNYHAFAKKNTNKTKLYRVFTGWSLSNSISPAVPLIFPGCGILAMWHQISWGRAFSCYGRILFAQGQESPKYSQQIS